MFVQVIRGHTKDAAALKKLGEEWDEKLRSGATGFLGVTAGAADDGRTFTAIRFESAEAAQKNSERPEQGEFAAKMGELMDGPPEFFNCPTVHLFNGGGSNDAGFVQAMCYKTNDVDGLVAMMGEFQNMSDVRPDLLGGMTAIADDGKTVFDINYFTSEEEARKNESQEMPAEMQETFDKFSKLLDGDIEFVDLRDPDLR